MLNFCAPGTFVSSGQCLRIWSGKELMVRLGVKICFGARKIAITEIAHQTVYGCRK